jgi:uncharacterized protein YkwD
VFFSAIAITSAVSAAAALAAGSSRLPLTEFERQTTEQINALRATYGLQPLRFSAALFESADVHCEQMVSGGYFGHRSVTGASFAARIESFYRIGAARYYAVGENLLWNAGPMSSAEMISRWLKSPEHRRNLLNPTWRQIGLATLSSPSAPGIYDGLAVTVACADFGVRS